MSEYTERHSVSRLIGAPPGYVGFEEGGQLTEAVRRKPYSVVLFDEIEKSHPLVFNTFLQVFDAGRLTDGKGRTVDFRNTVLIMTSNLGGDIIRKYAQQKNQKDNAKDSMQKEVWNLVQKTFPPEFINRLDQIIMFDTLKRQEIRKIVDLQIHEVEKRLKEQGLSITVSEKAKEYLASRGFDPVFGARPLKRVIENEIVDVIASQIIENKMREGDEAKVGIKDKKLTFTKN
jgi:ATP-dependent Clp protease ATP-binding subunit ClpA